MVNPEVVIGSQVSQPLSTESTVVQPKLRLTAEQIFLSPAVPYLSQYGSDIQRIIFLALVLQNPEKKITDDRIKELKSHAKNLRLECNVDVDMPDEDLKAQFDNLVTERDVQLLKDPSS